MFKIAATGTSGLLKITGLAEDIQKWLNNQYSTSESKAKVEKLNLSMRKDGKIYQGSLSLSGFINLTELHIEFSSDSSFGVVIPTLDLTNCPKLKVLSCIVTDMKLVYLDDLEELDCSGGAIISLNFLTKLNPEKLRILDISDNSFSRSDLSVFSHFVNLEVLKVGGYSSRRGGPVTKYINPEYLNRFYGSLEPLKNLIKLRELNIDFTDVDSGLEYLPDSLEEFSYSLEQYEKKREGAKVKKIAEELAPYNGDWKKWKEVYIANNPFLAAKSRLLVIKEQQIKELQTEIANKNLEIETNLTNQAKIQQLEQEKIELETKLADLQTKYDELLKQIDLRPILLETLKEKKEALEKLLDKCKFNGEQELLVKRLLEAESSLCFDINTTNYNYQRDKEEILSLLKKKGFKHIDKICELQRETTQLELELGQLKDQNRLAIERINQITRSNLLNNCNINLLLGEINISQGNLLIGNQIIGNNANFSYNNRLIELTTQIEIPPKSN